MWDFTHPPKEKMFWWYAHLQGMIGSYIAAWTAFCVVTIGPSSTERGGSGCSRSTIGVPAIIVTTAYYKPAGVYLARSPFRHVMNPNAC
jgi:hypothetical protein